MEPNLRIENRVFFLAFSRCSQNWISEPIKKIVIQICCRWGLKLNYSNLLARRLKLSKTEAEFDQPARSVGTGV